MHDKRTEHVTIHGDAWDWQYIKEQIDRICDGEGHQERKWRKEKWFCGPTLERDGSSVKYTGQKYDAELWTLDEAGWDHEHCQISWWTLFESDKPEEGNGYTDGIDLWICTKCFDRFVAPRLNG